MTNLVFKLMFATFCLCFVQIYAYRDCRSQDKVGVPKLAEDSIYQLGSTDLAAGSRIYGLSILPDGKTIASADASRLSIWNLESGRKISSIYHAAREYEIPSMVRTSRGNLAASSDGKVLGHAHGLGISCHDFPFSDKAPVKLPYRGIRWLDSLVFTGSSLMPFTLNARGQLIEWRVNNNNPTGSWVPIEMPEIKGAKDVSKSYQYSFSAGGGIVAVGGYGGQVALWDAVNKKDLGSIDVGLPVNAISLSADGKTLVVAREFNRNNSIPSQVVVFSLPDLKEIAHWENSARVVALSKDGALLATISRRTKDMKFASREPFWHEVELFDTKTGKLLQSWSPSNDLVDLVDFLPDGSGVVAAGPSGIIHYWDTKTGKSLRADRDHVGSIKSVQFSPQGNYVTASGDGTVRTWDEKGKLVKQYTAHERGLTSATLSRDGKLLFTGGNHYDESIRTWNTETGEQLGKQFVSALPFMVLSPDGKTLAVSVPQNGIALLDAETLKERKRLKYKQEPQLWSSVEYLAFVGNDRVISRDESTLRLWDVTKEGEAKDLELWKLKDVAFKGYDSNRAAPCGIAVSPSGKRFAASVKVARIGIWDTEKGKYVDFFDLPKMSNLYPTAVVYTSETTMAVGDLKGKIWLVDLEKKGEPKLLEGHQGAITCLSVSADGKLLASGSTDTTALIWKLPKP